MDETGAYYTEWTKSERKTPIQYTNAYIGEGNGNPLPYSCLENPVDRGAWWVDVHSVAQGQTWLKWLSVYACTGEKIAIHSSILAWRIPGTEEPGGLPSMGSHRVRHDWSDLAAAASLPHSIVFLYFFLHLCIGHCGRKETYFFHLLLSTWKVIHCNSTNIQWALAIPTHKL